MAGQASAGAGEGALALVVVERTARPVAGVRMASRPLPAWPVDALLWGFPLWWLLGMTPFIAVIMATVMAALMITRRGARIIPGVAPWLAFVAWVLPCGLMIDSALRLTGYGQRLSNLMAVAVVIVYVVNARDRLPMRRVLAGLTAVWFTVIIGGYLGTFFPEGRLTTPVGLLLPGALTSNEYIYDLVFPPFAEVQQPWGAPEPYNRPSAPFPYANGWGSAMALLTPVVLAQLTLARSLRVKLFLAAGLGLAIIPAVASLNRGMFIGMAVAVVYVGVRLLCRGAIVPVLVVAAGVAAMVFSFVGLGVVEDIESRTQYSSTNEGRAQIYRETFERTLDSPLFGYGAPRPSQILDISAGTQGHVWMVMFSYGFVGLGLFLWFIYGSVVRTWRAPGMSGLWLHSSLVVAGVIIFFYGLGDMQLLVVALLAATQLRESRVIARE